MQLLKLSLLMRRPNGLHWRRDKPKLRRRFKKIFRPSGDMIPVKFHSKKRKRYENEWIIFLLKCARRRCCGSGSIDPYVLGPSGSASGSVSHKYRSGSGPFHHQAKILRKTLTLLYDFLPVFRIRIRRIRMFLGLPDPHPNPLDRGTDHRIRNRI